jgi:hypothetical protein
MHRLASLRLPQSFGFLLLIAFAAPLTSARAQSDDGILPAAGTKALEDDYRKTPSANKLLSGATQFDRKKEQIDSIDMEAKFATYRFTWPEFQDGKDGAKTIDRLFNSFDGTLTNLAKNPNAKVVGPYFSKAIVLHAKEVIDQSRRKPIAAINGARVLARLAEHDERDRNETIEAVAARLGPLDNNQPAVANELAEALKEALNNKNDGVRYYALKGLNALLKIQATSKTPPLASAKLMEAVEAITALITQKSEFSPATTREEFEGYRSLRREAVRALAEARTPALRPDLRPALTLLKVVANDGLIPEARTDERLEAARGLARMKPDPDKNYQADYAAFFIGQLVADLADQSQRSKLPGSAKVDEVDKAAKELNLDAIGKMILFDKYKSRAWKILAAQLQDALVEMKTVAPSPYVNQIVKDCYEKVLRQLEEKGADGNPDDRFRDSLQPPMSTSLFKGDDKSAIKPTK